MFLLTELFLTRIQSECAEMRHKIFKKPSEIFAESAKDISISTHANIVLLYQTDHTFQPSDVLAR